MKTSMDIFKEDIHRLDDSDIKKLWDQVMITSGLKDFVPEVSVFDAARCIFEEMDKRGIPPKTHLFRSVTEVNKMDRLQYGPSFTDRYNSKEQLN